MTNKTFIVTTAKNCEHLLAKELKALGITDITIGSSSVRVSAPLKQAYEVCMWSRTAIRVLFPLAQFRIRNDNDLYQEIKKIDWMDHFDQNNTFAIDFVSVNGVVSHNQFGAQRVKDAIVDFFREKTGDRPSVDKATPDIRLNLFLSHEEATISLDLSGESLHRRGYRKGIGAAPLKENLAASLLLRAGWFETARKGGQLIDPMCGSGTFLIESAMIAGDIAPALLRQYFGFLGWKQFDARVWQEIVDEALERKEAGKSRIPQIWGFDQDPRALGICRQSLKLLGIVSHVSLIKADLRQLTLPKLDDQSIGLLITNPPYGERLGDDPEVIMLHQLLGKLYRQLPARWTPSLFSNRDDLFALPELNMFHQYPFFNGPLKCQLVLYKPFDNANTSVSDIPEQAIPFANRLKKNFQHLQKWARKNNISCYRVYDADLPEFAVAVDLYEDHAHIQEYLPPKSIDPEKASLRRMLILESAPVVLNIPAHNIHLKTRVRKKGKSQYEKLDNQQKRFIVEENGLKFWVNFDDYLDTGLFLDHRSTRALIREKASKKRFLNLFAYTGSVSVYAASGEAKSTTTVDMSATYLNWAKENMVLNRFDGKQHQFIQADCLQWISECKEKYDLIFLDPPTFSNSKRMDNTLDIQRDHSSIINQCLELLAPGGELLFSTNRQGFRLDTESINTTNITDITANTTDPDFKRKALHKCWIIS